MGESKRRVLVTGSTGHLGRQIVHALVERGYTVRALVRSSDHRLDVHETIAGRLEVYDTLRVACRDVQTVVCTSGARMDLKLMPRSASFFDVDYRGNLNLLKAALTEQVDRFVYISVHSTPALDDLTYVKAHRRFEEELQKAGIEETIVRPTGFFSAFADFPEMARCGALPLIGKGEAKSNPIHEQDLAELAAGWVEAGPELIEVGGPEILSRKQILVLAFSAAGKTPRFVRVPSFVFPAATSLIRIADPRLADLLRFLTRVSSTDVVAPATGTRRLADYLRSTLQPVPAHAAPMAV